MPTFAVTFPTTTPHKFQPAGNRDGWMSQLCSRARTRMLLLPPSPIAQGVSIALCRLNFVDLCVMSLDSNDGHLFVALCDWTLDELCAWNLVVALLSVCLLSTHTTDEMPPPQCFHNRRYKPLRWLHHPFSKYRTCDIIHREGEKLETLNLFHRFHLLHDRKRTPQTFTLDNNLGLKTTTILLPPNIHTLSSTPQTGITFLHHPHRR